MSTSKTSRKAQPAKASALSSGEILDLMSELISLRERVAQAELHAHLFTAKVRPAQEPPAQYLDGVNLEIDSCSGTDSKSGWGQGRHWPKP